MKGLNHLAGLFEILFGLFLSKQCFLSTASISLLGCSDLVIKTLVNVRSRLCASETTEQETPLLQLPPLASCLTTCVGERSILRTNNFVAKKKCKQQLPRWKLKVLISVNSDCNAASTQRLFFRSDGSENSNPWKKKGVEERTDWIAERKHVR